MQLPDDNTLKKAADGDINTLLSLDKRGFIIGADETPALLAERIRALAANINTMNTALRNNGVYELDDVKVRADEAIPQDIHREAAAVTEELYGFQIDWVPGFFVNPSFSFLFGGCSFYYYPDFFALFIIRKSFAKKRKWMFYNRLELMSHELCHIARIAMNSVTYEETFAYQTSPNAFRRYIGGLFLRQWDSFIFLGSAFALLLAQIVRTYGVPALPIAPFWCLTPVVVTWLSLRYWRIRRRLTRAMNTIKMLFGKDAPKVLFRLTDAEINECSALRGSGEMNAWLQQRLQSGAARWRVITARFLRNRKESTP